jgi:hypothetical protein
MEGLPKRHKRVPLTGAQLLFLNNILYLLKYQILT